MIDFQDLTGLFSTLLLITTAVFSLAFQYRRFTVKTRCALVVICAFLLLIPIGPVSVVAYVRAFIGDLSVTSLTVLIFLQMENVFGFKPPRRNELDLLCVLAVPVTVVFYPLALGFGEYDPYSLGYGSRYLLSSLLVLTLLAWATDRQLIVVSLSQSVLFYSIGWYESNNLWDYLMDPLFAVYAFGVCLFRYFQRSGVKDPHRIASG